jgi:tetratricopeptide (TPR) repeat protein
VTHGYHEVLEVIDRAIALAPEDLESRIIRIDTLGFLASATHNYGESGSEFPVIDSAIAESESLLKEHPEEFHVRLATARSYSMLISILYNGPTQPERMLSSADRIDELVQADDPESAPTVAVSMAARTAAGRVVALTTLGRFDEAEAAFVRGERLAQYLIDRDPLDATAIRALMTLFFTRGRNHEVQAREASRSRAERLEHLRLALSAYERYQELIAFRRENGMLPEWESHYPKMAQELVDRVEREIDANRVLRSGSLPRQRPPSATGGVPNGQRGIWEVAAEVPR